MAELKFKTEWLKEVSLRLRKLPKGKGFTSSFIEKLLTTYSVHSFDRSRKPAISLKDPKSTTVV